jgi:GNAT superfamily N-acetyltransferase
MTIRLIPSADTRPLRQQVLRPHQRVEELEYPGDHHPETFHLGAFEADDLVAVASFYHESMPADPFRPDDWRLRGMAVAPGLQGQGRGARLLTRGLEELALRGATRLWCNARVPAADFYRRLGFETHGAEFDIPDIGPHYLMSRGIVPHPDAPKRAMPKDEDPPF